MAGRDVLLQGLVMVPAVVIGTLGTPLFQALPPITEAMAPSIAGSFDALPGDPNQTAAVLLALLIVVVAIALPSTEFTMAGMLASLLAIGLSSTSELRVVQQLFGASRQAIEPTAGDMVAMATPLIAWTATLLYLQSAQDARRFLDKGVEKAQVWRVRWMQWATGVLWIGLGVGLALVTSALIPGGLRLAYSTVTFLLVVSVLAIAVGLALLGIWKRKRVGPVHEEDVADELQRYGEDILGVRAVGDRFVVQVTEALQQRLTRRNGRPLRALEKEVGASLELTIGAPSDGDADGTDPGARAARPTSS